MSFGAIAVIVCLVTVLAGIAATHPLELREHRWLKIALSLPLVVLIAATFHELAPVRGYFAMFSIGILGFIWKSPMAHLCSGGFLRLITGNMNQTSGIRAELAGPKALLKHGDLTDALAVTLRELEKDPLNYEGLLLLADTHEALDQPGPAARALEKLLRRPGLTADQRKMVRSRREKIEERQLVTTLNRR